MITHPEMVLAPELNPVKVVLLMSRTTGIVGA